MQQTEKYKLNLIESSDPFLPEGLNENTRKIENAMAAHEARVDQRVAVLEARHFAFGCYSGEGASQIISLPFKPKAVFTDSAEPHQAYYSACATDAEYGQGAFLKLLDDGFEVFSLANSSAVHHNFIAFG